MMYYWLIMSYIEIHIAYIVQLYKLNTNRYIREISILDYNLLSSIDMEDIDHSTVFLKQNP